MAFNLPKRNFLNKNIRSTKAALASVEAGAAKTQADIASSPLGKAVNTVKAIPGQAKKRVLGSFKKGGPVKKTGTYTLHKGEVVLPKKKRLMAKYPKYDKQEH